MPKKQATSYSVTAPGSQRKKNLISEDNYITNQLLSQLPTPTNLLGNIRDMRLTESLEILEKQGFTGDLAVFFLAIAQEVAA